MEWYAIEIISGKERQVISALNDWGAETLNPQRPVILKSHEKLRVVYKPLMPGYIIAKLQVTDFYKYKRDLRVEGMMIRICGLAYESIPLNQIEIEFFRRMHYKASLLLISKVKYYYIGDWHNAPKGYEILNTPPWADRARIEWYDSDRFKVRLKVKSGGNLKDHIFTTAAFDIDYSGKYQGQLINLYDESTASSGVSDAG